ncbi:MAG: heme-binding protein [Sulfitobacter sp.]
MAANLKENYAQGRDVYKAEKGDENLGGLKSLPGTWLNAKQGETTGFEGRGWNMIALPFENPGSPLDYRMLVNQYNEVMQFQQIDGPVPNRGIDRQNDTNTDQSLFALDYQQGIKQIAVADSPETDVSIQGPEGGAIHHEPGFFLNVLDERTDDLDIARLATVPHGDSVLAMGRSRTFDGAPTVPAINGLPIGATQDLSSGYLTPYVDFSGAKAFKGKEGSNFPGFDVVEPHKLLQMGIDGLNVAKTTELHLDTKFQTGGIVNIPFVVKQANPTEMTSTFWIMTLNDTDDNGDPKMALAYAQVVMLEFFDRFDAEPGRIKWPHVSINTMVFDAPPQAMMMQMPTT